MTDGDGYRDDTTEPVGVSPGDAASTRLRSLAVGDLIDRRFRVIQEAGRGAFGTVYRAIDTTIARDVALKVLHRENIDYGRFEREAEVLATVNHHHVVSYVAHGLTEDGRPYLAMEWLEGVDLARRIADKPLSIRDALVVAARAAQGLAAAHALGIVHRDIKPSNIYLVGRNPNDVRVIDFGIARISATHAKLTATGAVVGTPAYMAPEQARGTADPSPRIDVFALGCVLFECLSGSRPFVEPNDRALFARLLSGTMPRLSDRRSDAPPVLDVLLARMLAHDPADRFADASGVALAIAGLLSDATRLPTTLAGGPILTDRATVAYSSLLARTERDRELVAGAEDAVVSASGSVRHRDARTLVASFAAARPEDAALRAIRCAIALRERDSTLRIAVTTARQDTIVASGSGVLEGARAGDVVLDTATAAHVGREYELEPRGSASLLGRRRPSAGPALDGSSTPDLVGRARELAILDGVWAEVVAERCARVALLLGEGGIGKSRLLHEMLRRVPSAVRARGDRPTSTSPFAIIAQFVRAWTPGDLRAARAGLEADGLPPVERDFLCELAGLRPDDADAPHLQAARRDPMLMADAFHNAWLALVDAKLAAGPVFVAIDDLHEADPASVRLLDAALEAFAGRSLLVLATARVDEATESFAAFASRDAERVVLKPLRANVAIEMLRSIVPDATSAELERIVAEVGGNPMRLLELARLGVNETSPGSVRAAVEARLLRLDPFGRRVLRAGSVFGARFAFDGLLPLLGGESRRDDIEASLLRAEREQFVTREVGPYGELWAFRHGLLQECAYATLDRDERRAAHGAVGRWLAELPGADPSLVAWHFQQADERDHAFGWYEAASRAALQGRDLEGALRHCDAAMSCQPRGEDRARVALLHAEASFYRGDATDGKRAATQAMDAARPGSATWTTAAGVLVTSAGQRGDNVDVSRLAAIVRAQHAESDAVGQRVACLCRAATQLLSIGEHTTTRALLDEVESVEVTDPIARAWVFRVRSGLQVLDHDYEAAIATLAEAVRCHTAAGDGRGGCLARILLASVGVFAADFERANAELDVADQIARRTGADYLVRWAAYARGKILALVGEPSAARDHLARVRHDLAGSPRIVSGTHVYGALAALRIGDHAWAEAEARAGLGAHGAPATRAACLAAIARALVMAARPAESLEAATEASNILAALGRLEENESLVYLAAIEAARASGRDDEARDMARRARDRLVVIAAKLSTPARREAYLHGIDTHEQTLRVAFRLGVGS